MRTHKLRGLLAILAIATGSLFGGHVMAENMDDLGKAACGNGKAKGSPWHISNLYNCENNSFFVPYQLWTGAKWDGDKESACMHAADSAFTVNNVSKTTIRGPIQWKNPRSGKTIAIWVREKVSGPKTQYFACHENGIGRVYDNRWEEYYTVGRCKFPAGYDWKIGNRRDCMQTSVEITDVDLNSDGQLYSIKFKWWYMDRSGEWHLDHIYRYEREIGMTNAWKQ